MIIQEKNTYVVLLFFPLDSWIHPEINIDQAAIYSLVLELYNHFTKKNNQKYLVQKLSITTSTHL